MSALKPYSEKSKCGACGSECSTKTFRRVTNASTGEDKSYIVHRCVGCGYTWLELPLYRAQDHHGLSISLNGFGIGKIVLGDTSIADRLTGVTIKARAGKPTEVTFYTAGAQIEGSFAEVSTNFIAENSEG